MNPLVRRYLKTAIAFLIIGLGIGTWMLVAREFALALPFRARSAHTHALLVGFVMMMIAGVAFWMFPRPRADGPRYRPWLAELAYWAIAGGTGARVLLELGLAPDPGVAWRLLLVAAGIVQLLGIAVFFYGMWPRIRSAGAQTPGR